MTFRNLFKTLAGIACVSVGIAGGAAHATSITGESSAGSAVYAGQTAFPSVSLSLGPGYVLAAIDLYIDYDAAKLTFNLGASTINTGSGNQSLGDYLDSLAAPLLGAGHNYNFEPGAFSSSVVLAVPQAMSGPVVIQAAFLPDGLAPGAGASVDIYGSLADNSRIDSDTFAQTPTVTLLAAPVPEPEAWLLFAAGIGLVGAVARRRRFA